MSETFRLDIVSPEKVILQGQFTMVVVPGTNGDLGILPYHSPLISTLRPGLINVYQESDIVHQYYSREGFVHVNAQGCSLMVDECLALEDLSVDSIEHILQEKREALEKAQTASEQEALTRDLHFANLQLHLLKQFQQSKSL